jgi:hypothetical protein
VLGKKVADCRGSEEAYREDHETGGLENSAWCVRRFLNDEATKKHRGTEYHDTFSSVEIVIETASFADVLLRHNYSLLGFATAKVIQPTPF